ncbi:glycosyltransferase [Candidatus Fermentibacteria bacterium]|nr:glycosyltransferase [Candidatus Fermentibacteria bacterium]
MAPVPAGLTVLSPWPALPFGQDRRAAQAINTLMLRLQLSRAGEFMPPDIWWVYDPIAASVTRHYPSRLLVYDCVDRHAAYGGRRRLMDGMEATLLERADVVFVTAQGLVSHCRGAVEVHYVSNGFDEDLFAAPKAEPPRLRVIPRPRVGFIGGLAHWLDGDLLEAAARARPSWSFVLVGPIAEVKGLLPEAPNIHWLGPCARNDVPAYMTGFDVGMVPFAATPLTRTVNPLKAYEYLAAGIPVVSTRMPELDHLPIIRQASSPEEFVAEVQHALAEGMSEEVRRLRRQAAAPFSLQRGFETMCAVLAGKLA